MTDGKGVTCFRGCGQTIYFHDQIVSSKSGKKIPLERPVETLEEINLILSKQQEAPAHQCPNNPQQQSWGGTTKSGQFVQAKISEQQEKENADIQMMLKILIDVNRNVLEILGILQDRYEKKQEDFKNLTDDEIKKIADTERIDEAPSTQSNRSDYGF